MSNTGSPRFTDFPSLCACSESSLTNLIGSGLNLLCFQSHSKTECRWTGPEVAILGADQPRPQANSRYPNEKRKPGTKSDSEKAWHKMAKKSQFSDKKSQILLDEILLFSARIREYFGCISYIHPFQTFKDHCK